MKKPSFPLPGRFSRNQLLLIAAGCAVLLIAVFCLIAFALGGLPGAARPDATPESAESAQTATPEDAAPPQAADQAVQEAAAGTVLGQTADAGRSYVDGTLFIGDSNTARYMMYADETGQAFTTLNNNIGVVSMGAGSITTLECEKFKGSSAMYTIPEAVAMLKPQRIIICFGTNNLSGSSTDATNFISSYLKGLEAIETAWPYCDIIVSAIPPLDKQRENTNLTMTQVDAYNAALVEMCEDNGYKFLNSSEVLRDSATGWARTDYTLSDGVHLSKTAVTAYFEYVRTHAYIAEDRRPQPLGSIPTPDGVPANLISEDPIAVRGAKVPLEFVATHGGSLSGATSQLVKKGGTSSAVTAVPAEGFVFAGWTASTGETYSSATIQFTMPADANAGGVVLTAHFTPDAHEHQYVLVPGSETAATCLNPGLAKYACSICGEVIEKESPALGHDWDGGSRSGDQITYTCRRCGEHKTETVAHTHNFNINAGQKDPTCTEDGYIIWQCSCGEQTTEIKGALGHRWDGGTETTPPQVGVPGVKTYTCTTCGATYTEEIPALEPTPTPPTQPTDPGTEGGNTGGDGNGGDGGNQGGNEGSGSEGSGGEGSGGDGNGGDGGNQSGGEGSGDEGSGGESEPPAPADTSTPEA